uniref:Methyltransferase HEMK2 n=1 Tax=Cyprinus carpio carpio TaxID=630221 RepID=A0A8C1E7L0_CYPCA
MYPTPLYAPAGHGAFTDVYEPAEGSFLLMDALEKDATVCLEVGSGSGVVSAFLASVVGPGALYLCTDVNPAAAQCTLQTARCNHLQLQPVITDLVQCLLPRLNGKVDVLVFNPPYVVTPSDEVNENQKRSVMLHSQNHGLFYLVTVSENHPIVDVLRDSGLNGELCLTRQAGHERLSILRFSKSSLSTTGSQEPS